MALIGVDEHPDRERAHERDEQWIILNEVEEEIHVRATREPRRPHRRKFSERREHPQAHGAIDEPTALLASPPRYWRAGSVSDRRTALNRRRVLRSLTLPARQG